MLWSKDDDNVPTDRAESLGPTVADHQQQFKELWGECPAGSRSLPEPALSVAGQDGDTILGPGRDVRLTVHVHLV